MKIKEKITNLKLGIREFIYQAKDLVFFFSLIFIKYIEYYKQGELVKKEREKIVEYWKEVFDEDLDIKSVFNTLCGKITELKRKLESIIPKKIAEKLDSRRNSVILDGECISDLLFD